MPLASSRACSAGNSRAVILYSVGPDGKDDRGAFTIEDDGSISPESADLLFFLNGDRPSRMSDFESNRLREAPDDDDDK